jgi:hypothetical protein
MGLDRYLLMLEVRQVPQSDGQSGLSRNLLSARMET